MDHIVLPSRDATKVLVPVLRVFAHEFCMHRKYRQGIKGYSLAAEAKLWSDIDIMCGCPCGFRGPARRYAKFWERRVGHIEFKRSRAGDGYIDLNVSAEIWR